MTRKSANLFTKVPVPRVNRNLFDLSHEVKMSGKFGYLYPVLLMDTLPGDTIRDQMTIYARMAPMLAPVMHRIDIKTHFFFVPDRLLTDVWEDFITGGQDGTLSPTLPYLVPKDLSTSYQIKGSLWDYLGLPAYVAPGGIPPAKSDEHISMLPFRAYAKIFNDYYRDPNLDQELELSTDVTGNVTNLSESEGLFILRRKGWERDFFTAALPWAQRGAEVLMPLAGTGSVTYREPSLFMTTSGGPPTPLVGDIQSDILGQMENNLGDKGYVDNIESVDINSSDVSINDLRRSVAIQRWLENNARGGGRYIEQLEAHFSQRVPDFRLQRAEYLGGGAQPIQISEVLSTAETEDVPVGDMAGHGESVGKSNRFTYRCQEHGWILGIMSVIPRTAYMDGIDRMWSRENRFEFPWPELAHLGEQEIKNKEVYFANDEGEDEANNEVFGYIPRYAEMKFKNDRVAGDFRDTLLFWHLTRKFTQRPVLDSDFTRMLEDGKSADDGVTQLEETYRRIFAVQDDTDYLWFQLFHHLSAKRPLPYFGVPQL